MMGEDAAAVEKDVAAVEKNAAVKKDEDDKCHREERGCAENKDRVNNLHDRVNNLLRRHRARRRIRMSCFWSSSGQSLQSQKLTWKMPRSLWLPY